MSGTTNIFFIYAQADRALLLQILDYLQPLTKTHSVSFWYDDPIESDKPWYPQIVSRFEEADMYIPLVSNAFMHSQFVQQIEFKQLVDRYREKAAYLIPIILDECPWDVDFESDEYTFSFRQLHVLPESGKHISGWDTPKEALVLSTDYIRRKIGQKAIKKSGSEVHIGEGEVEKTRKETKGVATLPQGKGNGPEEARTITEPEHKAGNQKKEAEEPVPTSIEADPKPKRVVEDRQAHTEEKARLVSKDVEEAVEKLPPSPKVASADEGDDPEGDSRNKKRVLLGIAVAAVLVLGGVLLSQIGNGTSKDYPSNTTDTKDPTNSIEEQVPTKTTEVSAGSEADAVSGSPTVGELYGDGIVFELSDDGKKGLLAHRDDAGPMIWNDAMKIHETLGEGWRLPTHDELKKMYNSIGQGADNSGEFADDLYWSSTPFDENQAKMVRFSDGNATYHYNSRGTHRLFLVRAVREFDANR